METKYIGLRSLKKLIEKIGDMVRDGKWLPLKRGRKSDGTFVDDCVAMGYQSEATGYGSTAIGYNCKASGNTAHAENANCTASGDNSHAQGLGCTASGNNSHAEGKGCTADGDSAHAEGGWSKAKGVGSHAEGKLCTASGDSAHAEGEKTTAIGSFSHAQGSYNYDDASFIDMVGVGAFLRGVGGYKISKNASVIYVGRDEYGGIKTWDPKNGYQYLLDVGGYKGQEIGDAKSVQEVIADLISRIAELEKQLKEVITKPEIEEIVEEREEGGEQV